MSDSSSSTIRSKHISRSSSTGFYVVGETDWIWSLTASYKGFSTLIIGVHLDLGLAPNPSLLSIVGEFKNCCHHYVKIHPLG
jgi:hypothetical protein